MKQIEVYGKVPFVEGVICTEACLGRKFQITVAGSPGWLNFPNRPDRKGASLQPPNLYQGILQKLDDSRKTNEFWGRDYSAGQGRYKVDKAVLVLYPKGAARKDHRVHSHLRLDIQAEEWIKRLHEFLSEIGTQLPTTPASYLARPPLQLHYWDRRGRVSTFPSPRRVGLTLIVRDSALSLAAFRRIVHITNEGRNLNLAHRFIYEARIALIASDFTRCVVDAATCVEIAISNHLKKALRACLTTDGINRTLKRYRMLGPRIELCTNLGMRLPSRLTADLVQPRNAILHDGYRADRPAASKAFSVARETLRKLKTPLIE